MSLPTTKLDANGVHQMAPFNIEWIMVDDGDTYVVSNRIDLTEPEYMVLEIKYPVGSANEVDVKVIYFEHDNAMPSTAAVRTFVTGNLYLNQMRAVKMLMDVLDDGGYFDGDYWTDDAGRVSASLTKKHRVNPDAWSECAACAQGDDDISSPAHDHDDD